MATLLSFSLFLKSLLLDCLLLEEQFDHKWVHVRQLRRQLKQHSGFLLEFISDFVDLLSEGGLLSFNNIDHVFPGHLDDQVSERHTELV